jgi:hypothetical protein
MAEGCTKAVVANKRRTQTTDRVTGNPTLTRTHGRHQPNTHLNPSQEPRQSVRCITEPSTDPRSQTHPTHTHTCTEKQAAPHRSTQQTPAAKRQATNTAMPHSNSHPISSPNGAPPQEEPTPTLPHQEMSPHREDTNQHTRPPRPTRTPQTSSQCSPIT